MLEAREKHDLSPLFQENILFPSGPVEMIDLHFLEFSTCFFSSFQYWKPFPFFHLYFFIFSFAYFPQRNIESGLVPSYGLLKWKLTQINYLQGGTRCLHYSPTCLLQETIMSKLQKETNDLTDLTVFNNSPASTVLIPLNCSTSEIYTDQTNMGYVLSVKIIG